MKRRTTKRQPYLKSEDLAVESEKSQQQGSPTAQVCEYFKLIATHLLGDSRYRNYPRDLQEDMVSAALLKCVKNIKNYKKEKADSCFNYYTRCAEHAFWDVLGKHYKQMNIQRELTRQYADMLDQINTTEAKQLRDSLLKEDTTNMINED